MFTASQLHFLLSQQPSACAQISGSISNPNLSGSARFYSVSRGIVLIIEVKGLPTRAQGCTSNMFGLHIHEGALCSGSNADPFADVGMHYNPLHCLHPEHAGDLPALFGNQGDAFMVVLVSGFTIEEIVGRTIVIHDFPDEATTQSPTQKIACGQIVSSGCSKP